MAYCYRFVARSMYAVYALFAANIKFKNLVNFFW